MRDKRIRRISIAFALLAAALFAMIILNIMIGSVSVNISDMSDSVIIKMIRLPRLVAAAFLGGALALSGFLLQTFFHNPIAGPFVLGVSSGAKLVVAIAMVFFVSQGVSISSVAMIMAAFVGAMISMGLVLAISGRSGNMSVLVICGIMIGYICSAVTDIIVTFADDSNIVNLHNWAKGSFSGIDWGNVVVIMPVVAASFLASFCLAKPMSAYRQGETYAKSLGINIRRFRISLIIISSILAACVTAFAGPISFLGVATPHLMKRIFNTSDPMVMIPACFMGGGVFCLGCDLLARTMFAPTELGISTVTAVFGAPVVIRMMLTRKRGSDDK